MNQSLKPVFFTVLLGGLSMLAIEAQSPGEASADPGEHGDNPVVGSLPVEVTPDLDWMFLEGTQPGTAFAKPILGLVGDADLDSEILDASGVPTGLINRGSGFNVFGMEHSGFVTFPRGEGRKENITSKMWLPDAYIGGTIVMHSNVGDMESSLVNNLTRLPLRYLCTSIGPVVDAWFTLIPHRDSNADALGVHVVIVGETVTVTYIP